MSMHGSTDPKLIAYAFFVLIAGEFPAAIPIGVRNCSLIRTAAGVVQVRIGTPGPLTALDTPAAMTTEWSRAVQNAIPVVTPGSATFLQLVIQQDDDTTYRIRFFDDAGAATIGAAWFGLYTLVV